MRAARQAGAVLACLALVCLNGRGQDVRVSVETRDEEIAQAIAPVGSGFRAVWLSGFEFCSGQHGVMRAIDARGAFASPDQQAQVACNGSGNFDVAGTPSGTFVVVRHGGYDVLASLFDGTGTPLVPDIKVNEDPDSTDPREPRVALLPSGDFVVVWSNMQTGSAYGRILRPDGTMPGSAAPLGSGRVGSTLAARVGAFDTGEVVVAWNVEDLVGPNEVTVRARYFDGALSPVGAEFDVNQTPSGICVERLALSARGTGYLVAWDRLRAGICEVVARRFDRSAGALSGEVVVSDPALGGSYPAVAIDAQGKGLLLWQSYDASSLGIVGQRLDATGAAWGSRFQVNMTQWAQQTYPNIATLPGGDFVALFSSDTGTPTGDVFLRRFFFPVSLALAPGPSSANAPRIAILRPDGRLGYSAFYPYGAGGYGATVGAGDVDGGGLHEILTGPGPSPVYGPHVRAFQRNGTAISKVSFYAYGTLKYGVKERGGDVDGDGYAEVLTTPGPGAVFGPHVRGFDYDGTSLRAMSKLSFYAFGTLKYGANACGGNLDADGYDEVLAAPGPGGAFRDHVRGFGYDGVAVTPIAKVDFFPFASPSMYGATVAASDIESDGIGGYGDGYDEVVAGRGPDPLAAADLRLFDVDGGSLLAKYDVLAAYPTRYGITAAGGDADAGDTEEIATAPGPDPAAAARILCWEWNPLLGTNGFGATLQVIGTDDFTAFPGQLYGANVAIGTFE